MSTHDEGWEARANRLERRLAEAQGKLRKHGNHTHACSRIKHLDIPCDCGWGALDRILSKEGNG